MCTLSDWLPKRKLLSYTGFSNCAFNLLEMLSFIFLLDLDKYALVSRLALHPCCVQQLVKIYLTRDSLKYLIEDLDQEQVAFSWESMQL